MRDGRGIAEIRAYCAERGDYLVSDHALEKLRAHKFALRDVVDDVLLEESVPPRGTTPTTEVRDRHAHAGAGEGAGRCAGSVA